jgi:hypothetical protein
MVAAIVPIPLWQQKHNALRLARADFKAAPVLQKLIYGMRSYNGIRKQSMREFHVR